MNLIDVDKTPPTTPPVGAPQTASAGSERRRPGRTEVSESLLPLLRTAVEPSSPLLPALNFDPEAGSGEDSLAPARGIGLGLVLSVPLWVAIAATAFAIFR